VGCSFAHHAACAAPAPALLLYFIPECASGYIVFSLAALDYHIPILIQLHQRIAELDAINPAPLTSAVLIFVASLAPQTPAVARIQSPA